MSNKLFQTLLKNPNKLVKMYDTLFEKSDLKTVNLKAEKAIKSNAIVPEQLIEDNSDYTRRVKGAVTDVYFYQKWFLLSKALLITDKKENNNIIYDKLKYNPVDDELAISEYQQRINIAFDEEDYQPTDEETKLDSRAMCLAEKFIYNEEFRQEFSKKGQFETLINEALIKQPDLIEKACNPAFMRKFVMYDKLYFYNNYENMRSEEEFNRVTDSICTKPYIDELTQRNAELTEQKLASDNEISAKQNIRSLKQERDSKSIFWKIFRPISNLVSYVRLNSAISNYKETYILPKLDSYKNSDTYNTKLDEAMQGFMDEINSNEPLKSEVEPPKVYNAQELNNINLDNLGDNVDNDIDDEIDFRNIIQNAFDKKQDLNESLSSSYSNDDIKIDLNSSNLDK